ncbi:histidine kinase [Rhodocytophaga aerolata]|uniref:Histidine kinase n=1 Tax=Rhodocytophaga aerolata TaxID=455078 RepID=A0ABT8R3M7_9BACT|nr:histidine kinase [Rhodocytophaga aerolata]MDO1445813.1 histidine kinase [Rhodocytophaga aerolata]
MAESPVSDANVKTVFVACWLLLALLQAYALYSFAIDWPIALADSLLTNLLLASTCLLISNNLRYYRPEKDRYVYLLIWCLFLAGLWLFISYQVLTLIFSSKREYLLFLEKSLIVRFDIAFLTLGWIAMISALWYNRQDQKLQEQRKLDAEKLAREAELYKLRQQLQPHFLFNSLNSISALAGSRPEEARKMIHQLSDFLRGTLRKEEEQWVSLGEELQHLQLYLNIEKVRFGHRLSTEIDYTEECTSLLLPPMLLQPVVENAIKFGLYDTIDTVTITVQATCMDKHLVITIQNPYDPDTANPRQGTGFGLSGVQRRLFLLFGRNDLLETKAQHHTFTTQLTIPQK